VPLSNQAGTQTGKEFFPMNQSYIEAIVVVEPAADRDRVKSWFERRQLQALPMKAGFLITGTIASMEGIFGVDLTEAGRPERGDIQLPVPAALRSDVSSIVSRRPPTIRTSYSAD
jgi:hypothetical protein